MLPTYEAVRIFADMADSPGCCSGALVRAGRAARRQPRPKRCASSWPPACPIPPGCGCSRPCATPCTTSSLPAPCPTAKLPWPWPARCPPTSTRPGLLRSLLSLASCYANLSNGPEALRLLTEAQVLARRLHDIDALVRTYHVAGQHLPRARRLHHGLAALPPCPAAGQAGRGEPRYPHEAAGQCGRAVFLPAASCPGPALRFAGPGPGPPPARLHGPVHLPVQPGHLPDAAGPACPGSSAC